MHAVRNTADKSPSHLLKRQGGVYYNRRVPKHAVGRFGPFLGVHLSRNMEEAFATSEAPDRRIRSRDSLRQSRT